MKQKSVIFGASGFIGTNLANTLASQNFDVTCVSRSKSKYWLSNVKFIKSDLRTLDSNVLSELKDARIFHLASSTRPTKKSEKAVDEIIDNIIPLVQYLEHTKDLNCKWIFASSGGTVYGPPQSDMIDELHPTSPISSYGVCKLAMEGYFKSFKAIHGTNYSIARIANPYGPFQNPLTEQGLIAALLYKLSKNLPIEIWGDGTVIRDYIFIDDAVDALIKIAQNGASGRVYNVGSGEGNSVNSIIENIVDATGLNPQLRYMPARNIDVPKNILDVNRIKTELNWEQPIDLKSGILRSYNWFSENY